MTRTRVIVGVIACLCVAPTLASAQMGGMGGGMPPGGMGGRGGMGGMRGPMGGAPRAPDFAKTKDLEKLNVAELLLHEAKHLKLTDDEKAQLTSLRTTLAERNADLLARYDSLRKDFKPPRMGGGGFGGGFGGGMGGMGGGVGRGGRGGDDADEKEVAARDSAMIAMRTRTEITEELLRRRERDATEALALIHEDARPEAREKIDEQTRKIREKLPRPRGMDRDGGRGRDRGGPPN